MCLLQCRLRGKIDSNGCVAAFMEERLNMGLNFILSAEVRIIFASDYFVSEFKKKKKILFIDFF